MRGVGIKRAQTLVEAAQNSVGLEGGEAARLEIWILVNDYILKAEQLKRLDEYLEEKVKEYTGGHGSTVSIDASGTKDSLLTLLKATGNAGRVMVMGFSTAPVEINQFLITSKELDVRGSRLQNKMFGKAIEQIQAGKLDLSGSVSHTFPLAKAQEAFDFVDSHDPSIRKIVFTFENGNA